MAGSNATESFSMEDINSEVEVLKAIYGHDCRLSQPKDVEPYSRSQDESLICLVYIDITELVTLLFLLKDDYPCIPPGIRVEIKRTGGETDLPVSTLENHLENKAAELIGSSMLFDLVETAKEWLEENQFFSTEQEPRHHVDTPDRIPPLESDLQDVCKFFLKDNCTFGGRCRNVHPDPNSNGPVSVKADKLDQRRKERDTDKKPPMRTATDIIKRLRWDKNLDGSEFTVGYLDRFTGIVEQPFGDFSWEDIASVDDTTALAIPKHRIQYFKFKGQIVWDKRCRLDHFFGSTGSGITILDILTNHQEANNKEDEKEDLDEIENEQMNQSEDGLSSNESLNRAFKNADRPNYFVALPITDPGILTAVKRIQERVKVHQPDLSPFCISLSKLHLTLCTLRISSQRDLQTSIQVFFKFKEDFLKLEHSRLFLEFNGLRDFDGRVLYSPPSPNPVFTQITRQLTSHLAQGGVKLLGNKAEFTPHLTLVKIPKHMSKTVSPLPEVSATGHGSEVSGAEVYAEFTQGHLGTQAVQELQLCAMTGLGDDGGYPIQSTAVLFPR